MQILSSINPCRLETCGTKSTSILQTLFYDAGESCRAISCRVRIATIVLALLIASPSWCDAPKFVEEVLEATGVSGGFVVQLGASDSRLTSSLHTHGKLHVHALDRDPQIVSAARKHLRASGLYGTVSVDRLRGQELPYIDNVVNLIVGGDLDGISMDEVMRVLAPEGVAYLKRDDKWLLRKKPRPENIDEWTHYLHDASGNAVAHDDQVGPPRRLQWIGSPRWSRHHDRMASLSAMVSAGGRVFYIMDEGSRVSIQLPPKWMLIARDAFNGTVLWKKPIPTWHNHLWPLKSGPTQLARRLVADKDTVYVTLGLRAPLTAIDAATGKTIRAYQPTDSTEEFVQEGKVLFALVNKHESPLFQFGAKLNVGDQKRVREEFHWNQLPRRIVAVHSSGELLWEHESKVVPLTLAADQERVFYHNGTELVCLNRATGVPLWKSVPMEYRRRIPFNFGPKLVIYKDVVLFAGGDRTMRGLDIKSGRELWSAPHAQSGYASPEDLLVSGGLVWNAPTTRTQDSGVFKGRDPATGEVKAEFAPDVETYWFHHRCYIAKATDKYLLPSRTGIEFVDPSQKHWDINHWVRGGCLYGIMPCNGLVYTPPHNCACYPEAKLYGLNALAPSAQTDESVDEPSPENRWEQGPAFDDPLEHAAMSDDWPTYRGDNDRSGTARTPVSAQLKQNWEAKLGGRLSAPTIANGKIFVAQPDQHTVHALHAKTGEPMWQFTTGARVDSPPTYDRGRVVFGSADGCVYSLRATDGKLAWRFRGAPKDRRMMAFEQLESLWPIHGSVLAINNEIWFACGRSNYLDGGLRLIRLEASTGKLISETKIDERDPQTGENLQEKIRILNMPVGLTDILCSDGNRVFMRSQEFDRTGQRKEIAPHSGQPAQQGSVQKGDTAHLFAPMGFLDDTWFHRSYWVYGRSFAGGHGGYFQAGKYTPSGRILVVDDQNVYGFGRKPKYYRWTTTMEHQLFSTSKNPPEEAVSSVDAKVARRQGTTNMVRFQKTKSMDPTNKPIAVEAWVNAAGPNGVVVARGGPSVGYSLWIKNGKPHFSVRTASDKLVSIAHTKKIVGKWTHLVGAINSKMQVNLFVDGRLVESATIDEFIPSDPAQSLEIGADEGGPVAAYTSPNGLVGAIDELRVYHGDFHIRDALNRYQQANSIPKTAKPIIICSFDEGNAKDTSGHNNNGEIDGGQKIDGKIGLALRFRGTRSNPNRGSFVQHHWVRDVPLLVRAMVKAGDHLFIMGPPDLIDEEDTFQRIVAREPSVIAELEKQNNALNGEQGSLLQVISASQGNKLAEYKIESLPTWDSLAAAGGQLYLTTIDGSVLCLNEQ